MQLNKEAESSPKQNKKRPTSGTRFPKSQSTFVVAFALRETYDDLITAQQMICNKRSPQESINSITPTNSLKIFESNQTVKLFQILDSSDDKNEDSIIENSDANHPETSDLKTEDMSLNEITESSNSENEINTTFQTNPNNCEDVNQPEIIFNATNFGQKHKENKFVRKFKSHKNAQPRCCFKCKLSKNTISNRIEKYYGKTKYKSVYSGNKYMEKGISNITTVVSRTSVLKRGLAKENLLDENEPTLISNDFNLNDINEEPLVVPSSPNSNQFFVSNLSDNTIVEKCSNTLLNENEPYNTPEASNEISLKNATPYKTDVINVAVAVAYKHTIINSANDLSIANKEKFTHLESLTSTESINKDTNELTSTVPSYLVELKPLETDDSELTSNATLIADKSNFETSSDDLFDMARTSSELNQLSDTSTSTLKNEVNKIKKVEKSKEDFNLIDEDKRTLLQKVINLGYYPETTASTSSAIGLHDVIVTENTNKSYSVETKNMGDNHISLPEENLLKKTFNNREVSPNVKNINLPNQAQIKAMIDGYDMAQQRKCADEVRHYPVNIPEMWDRLTIFFDVAFKKLEDSVTDKILKELKAVNPNPQVPIPSKDVEKGDVVVIEPTLSNKLISAQNIKKETDECLQCDLIHSNVLDNIMMKLVHQAPKIIDRGLSPKSLHRLKKPKLMKDYFEILKAPVVVDPQVETDKVDTVTMTTIVSEGEVTSFHRMKLLLLGPLRFVRENVLVISSVPGFLVIVLIMYGLLMLILQSS